MITIHHRVSAAYRLRVCVGLKLQPKCFSLESPEINPKRFPCDFTFAVVVNLSASFLCLHVFVSWRNLTQPTRDKRPEKKKRQKSLATRVELCFFGFFVVPLLSWRLSSLFGHELVCLPLTFLLLLVICLQMLSKMWFDLKLFVCFFRSDFKATLNTQHWQ